MDFISLPYRYECLLAVLWNFIIFTNPSARAGYDTRSIFKRSLTGLNSEYSFSKTEEPCLPYYLPTAGGRIIEPFPRVLVLCEMQSVSSRIWTRVAVSISYDDNHYTTGTSFELFNNIFSAGFTNLKQYSLLNWFQISRTSFKRSSLYLSFE